MAHEIDGNNCVYSTDHGGIPWHRIGTALNRVYASDVVNHAGFGRRIVMVPLQLNSESPLPMSVPSGTISQTINGYRATLDMSSGRVLGVVTNKYQVLQPEELLAAAEFLVNEFGAKYSLAAQLRDGKREIISMQLPDSAGDVAPDDSVKSYFNLANGHDGKLSVCVGSSDIRVVCANTLSAWLTEGAVQIRHRDGVQKALARAVSAFTVSAKVRREFYTAMSMRKMTPDEVNAYFDACVGEHNIATNGARSIRTQRWKLDEMNFINGVIGVGRNVDTLWGAFNAVTQLATHGTRTKAPLDSIYFGAAGHLLETANAQAKRILEAA